VWARVSNAVQISMNRAWSAGKPFRWLNTCVRSKGNCRSLPYATPISVQLSCGGELHALSFGMARTSQGEAPRCRKSASALVPRHAGAGGMTHLRAVAHLGMSGGEWTESKKADLDKADCHPTLGLIAMHLDR
jgi:hypothetical protein